MDPHPPPSAVPPSEKSGKPYREVTLASIIFGVVVGGIMNAAITYAGLKIGFTIVGSAIAAVLGFGVLRGLLRRGSILETNIGQTIASAVNTTNAGIIFTVPVLMMLAHKEGNDNPVQFSNPDFWWITLACIAGALLGVVFIVPLRKQMLDLERLRFPSATAVAAILKSPGAGAGKSLVLVAGAVVAMLVFLPAGLPALGGPGYSNIKWRMSSEPAGPGDPTDGSTLSQRVDRDRDGVPDLVLTDDKIDLGRIIGLPDDLQLVFAIAPFAIGAGYLTGRAGLVVLSGGLLAYLVLNPIAFRSGWMPETILPFQAPDFGLAAFNRPLGIGLLLGGALMGIVAALPAMREAMKSLARSGRTAGSTGGDEMSLKSLLIIGGIGLALLLLALEFGGAGGAADAGGLLRGLPGWLVAAVIALVGAAWIWFAGIIIAQCTGMTDWSPISGMALLTVVLVMFLAGSADVVSAVMLGAALCVAIACASDMMADLKTGYLVGGVPRRQQWVEVICAVIGPLITMSTLVLIASVNVQGGGPPIGPGTETAAPQAQALQTVIEGVRGGEMPYALYGFGALLGVLLGLAAFPGLGVLVGLSMYLPVFYILTYGLGCIANIIVARIKGRQWAEDWGVPFCAGLIVGEAVLALTINSIVLIRG